MHKNKNKTSESLKFIAIFAMIFLATYILLFSLNLVPSVMQNNEGEGSVLDDLKVRVLQTGDNEVEDPVTVNGEVPVNIKIPKIGTDIVVLNPNTTNSILLDEQLKKGVVRYPGSGLIGKGNMLIFGHSADIYKNVVNPAYKAFNGISKLVAGDEIQVSSEGETFVYKVRSIRLANAEEVKVSFSNDKNMLTLSTCNTFGKKEQRYVVEADFTGKL